MDQDSGVMWEETGNGDLWSCSIGPVTVFMSRSILERRWNVRVAPIQPVGARTPVFADELTVAQAEALRLASDKLAPYAEAQRRIDCVFARAGASRPVISVRNLSDEAEWLGLVGDDYARYVDKPHRYVEGLLKEIASLRESLSLTNLDE